MIIEPKIRGFICTTAHPLGCAAHVQQWIDYVKAQEPIANGPKKVLVIGASTGYGLASRITAAFASKAQTIGLFFEKPASGKRTASAGWYNSAAFEQAAHAEGLYAKSINGDAFSDEIRQQTIELIKKDWQGGVDCVIYSLASPVRKDPKTGTVHRSALKPIGDPYTQRTVDMMSGEVSEVTLESATQEDIDNTVKVMGGEDWEMWIDALYEAGVLADSFTTTAYSYIGPQLTYPIYREGTIGKAKEHLETSAKTITQKYGAKGGNALVSVNKALVTQASSAIPVVPLYLAILYQVMKQQGLHEGCIEQMYRLFKQHLYSPEGLNPDQAGRVRIDDWEMKQDVQGAVDELWDKITTDNIDNLTDIDGVRSEFYKLFGFGIDGVDYAADVDPDVKIGSMA